MKVVFLDFDGPLCTRKTYNEAGWERYNGTDPLKLFDRRFVQNVNTLCERTGARVVISSYWRTLFPGRCEEMLREVGFTAEVIGETPSEGLPYNSNRYDEIRAWLDLAEDVERFVVIDDDMSCRHFHGHKYGGWVFTDFYGPQAGFTEDKISEAVKILEGSDA